MTSVTRCDAIFRMTPLRARHNCQSGLPRHNVSPAPNASLDCPAMCSKHSMCSRSGHTRRRHEVRNLAILQGCSAPGHVQHVENVENWPALTMTNPRIMVGRRSAPPPGVWGRSFCMLHILHMSRCPDPEVPCCREFVHSAATSTAPKNHPHAPHFPHGERSDGFCRFCRCVPLDERAAGPVAGRAVK